MIRCLLILLSLSITLTHAKEGSGRWTRESKAKYSYDLLDYLHREQIERNNRLGECDSSFKLDLHYLKFPSQNSEENIKLNAKYLEGRMGDAESASYRLGLIKDLQRNKELIVAMEEKAEKVWKPSKITSGPSEKVHTAEILGLGFKPEVHRFG